MRIAVALLVFGIGLAGSIAAQDRTDPVPPALAHVGVTEKLDAELPLALPFFDEAGKPVALADFIRSGRPVILTLNYYRCPMLCTLELNGLVEGLKGLDWTIGREFEVVTVSIDPKERPPLAQAKKQQYLADYAREGSGAGWHFLTGSATSIDALASSVGFAYEYDAAGDQYGHAAVIFLVTPDGRVSRYLYGVAFEPQTLKLGLLEASQGHSGSAWERFILYCYHYDSNQGRYSLAAMRIMRLGGAGTVLVLGAALSVLWLRERRRFKVDAA